jgi:hypothetical protein
MGRADPSTSSLANPEHLPINHASLNSSAIQQFNFEKLKELVSELEVPFDPSVIEWRVTNTANAEHRGQIIPYASPRAYTDRLNALVLPAGWTRKYAVHTSVNFERAKDKKIVAKILVTCELTVFGVGSHSATGEEWADNENALTAAEAQAFKRAATCFGLGRYLYHFTGTWVDLDERKRPKSVPRLFGWATPQGWRQGLRPGQEADQQPSPSEARGEGSRPPNNKEAPDGSNGEMGSLIGQIVAMAPRLRHRLYRGVLKSVAKAWNPRDIKDAGVLRAVLAQMQAAEQELRRLHKSLSRVAPGPLTSVLRSFGLKSLDQIDNLDNLKRIAHAIGKIADAAQ